MPYEGKAVVKDVIQRTYNVKSIRVSVAEEIPFIAGQYLIVSLKDDSDYRRALSISNSPTEKGYIEFTKKLIQSNFSKTLDSLKIGDEVKIRCPFGQFTYNPDFKKIAFLSGGIGITPIRSMCKYIVDKKDVRVYFH